MAKKQRRRVSADKVKENAERGSGGGSDWFQVKENVGRWSPDKAGRYNIDILPYEVKSESHPDDVEKGCLWYKLPFAVHHGVGASNQSLVCPKSVGGKCPICDERSRLYKEDSDANEDIIAALRPQRFVAFNILSPEDDGRVDLFIFSFGKFYAVLKEELKDVHNEEHLGFFDVTDAGRTLKVRFSEEDFMGNKYLQASRIDFLPREEMDEDEILDKTVCLEDAIVVPPYDKLKALFEMDGEDEGGDDDIESEDDPKPSKRGRGKAKSKPEPDPELDDDDCIACEGTGKNSKGRRCPICKGTGKKPEPDPEPDGEDDSEPDPEPSKKEGTKKTTTKKAGSKSSTPKCPVEGGKFGQVDQYDECDDCPFWNECEEASD